MDTFVLQIFVVVRLPAYHTSEVRPNAVTAKPLRPHTIQSSSSAHCVQDSSHQAESQHDH